MSLLTRTVTSVTPLGRSSRTQRSVALTLRLARATEPNRSVQRRTLSLGPEFVTLTPLGRRTAAACRATAVPGQVSVSDLAPPAGTLVAPLTVLGSTVALAAAPAGKAAKHDYGDGDPSAGDPSHRRQPTLNLEFLRLYPCASSSGPRACTPFSAILAAMHDLFDTAYLEGVTEEIAPPQESGHELMPRAALAEAFALEGCVLTPERAIEKGYVVVGADRTIASVSEAKPQGVPVHRTDGVICPGLIDLHGHPEFNIFAAWEPPREFVNRYAWRGSDLYKELVREPQNKLLGALPPKTQLRYAEIRALVGGVTAIQGTGGQATSYQDEALVRNVDKWIFGEQRARSMIDLPSGSRGRPELESILAGIESGKVRAFYIHLAEGRSDNERSREELDTLVSLGGSDRAHGDHPRHRAERGAARRREGRGGFAGVVAAVEPAAVRGDHEGGGGAADRPAGGVGRGLAALGQHQPAGGAQGRAAFAARAGQRSEREAAGGDGHLRRRFDRRPGGQARQPPRRGGPRTWWCSSAARPIRGRTSLAPIPRGSSW